MSVTFEIRISKIYPMFTKITIITKAEINKLETNIMSLGKHQIQLVGVVWLHTSLLAINLQHTLLIAKYVLGRESNCW